MDLGVVTLGVAVSFGVLGMIIGFFIGKFSCKGQENKDDSAELKLMLEKKLSNFSTKLQSLQSEVKNLLSQITENSIAQVKSEIEKFISEIESLKSELQKVGLSPGSLLAFEKALESLRSLEISLPNIDKSILTKINDNLTIVRADLQALAMKKEKEKTKPSAPQPQKAPLEVEFLIDSVDSAIRLAKELNARAVKDELLALASLLKEKDKDEFLKDLDKQAITSKELVVVLTGIKKELEGVKR
ncbi:MAG: hypothetical protein ABGX27_08405 [Desulfurobacteriaceae bacterium]